MHRTNGLSDYPVTDHQTNKMDCRTNGVRLGLSLVDCYCPLARQSEALLSVTPTKSVISSNITHLPFFRPGTGLLTLFV